MDLTILGFVILEVFPNLNDPMILLIPFCYVVQTPCTLSHASIVRFPSAAPSKACALLFSPLKGVCSAFQFTSPGSLPLLFITTSIENIFLGRMFADLYPSFLAPEYTQLIKGSVVRSTA